MTPSLPLPISPPGSDTGTIKFVQIAEFGHRTMKLNIFTLLFHDDCFLCDIQTLLMVLNFAGTYFRVFGDTVFHRFYFRDLIG